MTRPGGDRGDGRRDLGRAGAPAPGGDVQVWPVAFDRPMAVVLVASGILMLAPLLALLVALDPDDLPVLGLLVGLYLAIGALIWAFTVPTRYELDLVELRVQAGRLRYRMAWRAVVRVELVWSVVSNTTAGWTFSRVRLSDAAGNVLEIGPRDRVGFVAEVLARAPALVPDPRAAAGTAWRAP